MATIPLILKLKKLRHREVAKAQDLIIEELYAHFDRAVLHGGTAIWRCYKGNRFSEDIDVYLPRNRKALDTFFEGLRKRGFGVKKKKISERSLFSVLELNKVIVRVEAIFKEISGSLKEYETAEGNLITVYTLRPEQLIQEKTNAYINRLKIRDLYDIFFLLRHVQNKEEVLPLLKLFVNKWKPPLDEKDLRVLIIEGIVPDCAQMLEYIKNVVQWEKKNI